MRSAIAHIALLVFHASLTLITPPRQYATYPPTNGRYMLLMGSPIDGDTIRCWHLTPDTIRLYGIQAPERAHPQYDASKANLGQLVPTGSVCECDLRGREKYGRLLADVRLPAGGGTATQAQIAGGFGVAWDGKGPRP